jgi:hypothetical protein
VTRRRVIVCSAARSTVNPAALTLHSTVDLVHRFFH